MTSPLTDRSVAPYAPADDVAAGPLRDHVVRAVAEIAGAAGAWCPALALDGARVAYVTDRSGIPGEGHTIVDREHVVELSAAVVAWFDRWL